MGEDNRIDDQSADRQYFVLTPRIVRYKCRDVYEIELWNTIKEIAGETGECYISTEDLALLSMMSTGKCSQCRQRLIDIGLLDGEIRKDPGYPQPVWHLRIPDVWAENIRWSKAHKLIRDRLDVRREQRYEKRARRRLHQVKASSSEEGPTPDEKGIPPYETKKIHKADPQEVWDMVLEELRYQMTRATFDTWLRGTTATAENGIYTIHVRDHYAVEWLEARWIEPIKRTLTGVTGEACSVRFEEG